MTYKEFKEWCDENRFVYEEDDGAIHVLSDNSRAGTVSKNDQYHMDSWYYDESVSMVFEKLVELARTPLHEREEPKRYIVKVPKGGSGGFFGPLESGFYALRECGTLRYMHHNYDPDLTSHYVLTEEQIRKIDERFMAFAEEAKE